jgi:hypothetical protein
MPSPSGCGGTSWIGIQQGMLAKGEYAAALAMFDNEDAANDLLFRQYGVPRWHGTEDLTGKRIIVVHQWGLGDCVMAVRYLQLLKAGSINVAVPDPLGRIVARDGLNVFGAVIPVEWFDYYVPIMRLIGYFDHIPRPPYLTAAPSLPAGESQWRLGIAWQGNPKHLRDATRSIELSRFLDLLPRRRNVKLYSLQNRDHEAARAADIVAPVYQDFAEVAAVAAAMDEIIVVDTAVSNLAGAMALKANVLLDYNHDWRWHRGDEWYPTVTRCVQSRPGDWGSAFAKL